MRPADEQPLERRQRHGARGHGGSQATAAVLGHGPHRCIRERPGRACRDHGLRPRRLDARPQPRAAAATRSPSSTRSASAFRRLGPDFAGRTVTGVGFDRDTLIEAGIERGRRLRRGRPAATTPTSSRPGSRARPSASTTSSPASTTRAAPRSTSGSASRPSRPSAGPPTEMLRRLLPEGAHSLWRDPTGARPAHRGDLRRRAGSGRSIRKLEDAAGARVAFLTRFGVATLATAVDRAAGRRPAARAGRRDDMRPGRAGPRRSRAARSTE